MNPTRAVRVSVGTTMCVATVAVASNASAQGTPCSTVPGPVVANASCTVTVTPIAATTADGAALAASGSATTVAAPDITFNVGAANATGIFARDQATVNITGASSVNSTSATAATSAGQIGLRAAAGATINADGLRIAMQPTGGNNITAVRAENGGTVSLTGASIDVGLASRTNDYGLVSAVGGTIIATDTVATTYANFSNAARAAGGSMTLNGGSYTSRGAGNAANGPAPAVAAVAGGQLTIQRSASGTGTVLMGGGGNQAYALLVSGTGSAATVSGATLAATGGSAAAAVLVEGGASANISESALSAATYYGLWARTGAQVTLTNSDITIAPVNTNAVNASGVGTNVTIQGGTLSTGGQAPTILASDATVTVNDATIVSTGDANAPGVYASTGSNITINRGTIDAYGTTARLQRVKGVTANLAGARLTVNDAQIRTHGDESIGVAADDGATVNLNRTAVTTAGRNAIGVYVGVDPLKPDAATVNATATTVDTAGQIAHGVQAQSQTSQSIAAIARLTAQSRVTTRGDGAVGLRAVSRGRIEVFQSTVSTAGTGAYGVLARDALSQVNLDGTSVTASGADAHGGVAQDGGAINGVSATVMAGGSNAAALYVAGSASPATASLTNSTLRAASGPAIAMSGTGVVTLSGGSASSPGDWLRVGQTSNFPPLALDEPLIPRPEPPAGDIDIPGPAPEAVLSPAGVPGPSTARRVLAVAPTPGAATVELSGGTVTGSATTLPGATSLVTLRDGATWNLTGDSNLTSLGNTGSQILFSPPVGGAFKTLTVGSYTGGPGSVIGLNTVLAADGASSDRVIIDGGVANGQSGLRIANAGGAGAVTVGNGIQVVGAVNGGTTAANAFVLNGRAVAGPYEYRLFRGASDGSAPDDWYLRSEAEPPQPPPVPPPPPGPPPPAPEALFRPEVAAYLANQRLAGQMFVHSLHDRLGESQYAEGAGFNPREDRPRSAWLRAVGKWEGSRSRDDVFKTSTDTFLLHGGAELAQWGGADRAARGHLGLMASYGYADTDTEARANPARAHGKVEGWMLGVYGTWYQNDENKLGAYVDTWFQYGWFTNRVEGDQLPTVKYHARGLALSGEAGYAWPVRNDWIVEPQAQLIYINYREGDITEPNGTRVSGADADGVVARLGIRTHRTWTRDDGRKLQPYVTLNWWYTDTGSNIDFNQIAVGTLYPHNRFELKLGLNADLGKRWTGWANVAGAWGQQGFYQYALRLGIKRTW